MDKPTVLTRLELEAMAKDGCDDPKCTAHRGGGSEVIYLHQVCHPPADGVFVSYRWKDGIVRLECATCRYPIIEVKLDGKRKVHA
jgi:hypothetical protein